MKFLTSECDRRLLLQLARDAIVAHVRRDAMPAPDCCERAAERGAAFVTLHHHGNLRGCIGHLDIDDPLGRVIVRCAVAACSADPRFPPVAAAEVDGLDIELSLLGPLEPIDGAHLVEIGRHGLVVEKGWQRGLLLPQVAVEWSWDAHAFLAHTCQKAGLPLDAWTKGARIWRFEAEVFGEGRTGGR